MDNVICLCGERKRGKDFLARALEPYGYTRLAFGDEARKLANQIYPWYDGFSLSDEEKDQEYKHPNNTQKATGRDILITTGKVREVDGAYFVRMFDKNQMQQARDNPDKSYVITDLRTPEEFEYLVANNIKIIKVIRNMDIPPHHFEQWVREFDSRFVYNNNDGRDPQDFVQIVQQIRNNNQ